MDTLSGKQSDRRYMPAGMKLGDIAQKMPRAAAKVADLRRTLGAAWVNDAIRAGIAGEPGAFWAFDSGLEIGLPSEAQRQDVAALLAASAGTGSTCCVVIRRPPGESHA